VIDSIEWCLNNSIIISAQHLHINQECDKRSDEQSPYLARTSSFDSHSRFPGQAPYNSWAYLCQPFMDTFLLCEVSSQWAIIHYLTKYVMHSRVQSPPALIVNRLICLRALHTTSQCRLMPAVKKDLIMG